MDKSPTNSFDAATTQMWTKSNQTNQISKNKMNPTNPNNLKMHRNQNHTIRTKMNQPMWRKQQDWSCNKNSNQTEDNKNPRKSSSKPHLRHVINSNNTWGFWIDSDSIKGISKYTVPDTKKKNGTRVFSGFLSSRSNGIDLGIFFN